jgi:hypothetical protein
MECIYTDKIVLLKLIIRSFTGRKYCTFLYIQIIYFYFMESDLRKYCTLHE